MAVFFSMSHGYLKHTMRQQPKGTEKWYNTKEFGDFNANVNLGNRYRSGDFNAPSNSIFSRLRLLKWFSKTLGQRWYFLSAFHLLLLLDLQMTYMTMFSAIVNIICSRVWFFDHIFLELVGNLTLLTKYLIEERDDDALDNNYCSKVFL